MDEGKHLGMGDASTGGTGGGRSYNGAPFRPKKKATIPRKSRAQTLKRGGPGSAKPRSDHAIALYANDPHKQMANFLDGLDPQAFIGRVRSVSHLTETRFGQTLKRMIGELSELNMPIQRIDQVSRRHVAALVVRWVNEEKQVAATVNNKVSFIRKFCELIGKVGAIPRERSGTNFWNRREYRAAPWCASRWPMAARPGALQGLNPSALLRCWRRIITTSHCSSS